VTDGPVASDALPPRPRRGRRALLAAVAVGVVAAVLIAVLAKSKPAADLQAKSPLIGHQAPPIVGPVNGRTYSLTQDQGRWVLVNFLASWCVPCQQEMPALVSLSDQHAKTKDAAVLSVRYDVTDGSPLAQMMKRFSAGWPVVDDPQAKVDYGVSGIPESFLVDPQGVVVAWWPGPVTTSGVNLILSRGEQLEKNQGETAITSTQ
jgi:cytochrome c biogenesis protein CcmG/thiol:disulfide interchange protein DsbE